MYGVIMSNIFMCIYIDIWCISACGTFAVALVHASNTGALHRQCV